MGSLWGEYVFIGSSDNARSNCTAFKKRHGAFYFHEPPSGPAFGTRDAYATNLINSNDFFVVCQTHEDITLLLAADYSIDGAVETPCFPILGGENVRQIVIAESVGCVAGPARCGKDRCIICHEHTGVFLQSARKEVPMVLDCSVQLPYAPQI